MSTTPVQAKSEYLKIEFLVQTYSSCSIQVAYDENKAPLYSKVFSATHKIFVELPKDAENIKISLLNEKNEIFYTKAWNKPTVGMNDIEVTGPNKAAVSENTTYWNKKNTINLKA